ncbi:MAG: type II toxin-antitoxin system VapC family toxin [Paludibacter sp.]|nr:type II toxin-antitoxin system VapC family toxin [Paludibacter sp.]
MRYLIDTNILIFALSNQEYYIDKNVYSILNDYENTIYVSYSSVFEAIHLYQSGRIKTSFKNVSEFLKAIKTGFNIQFLHSKTEHFETFSKLPLVSGHNDPIDRIIISQAITEKLPLISSDGKFKHYKTLDFIYNDKKAR